MKWAVVRKKLARADRAIDKAIARAEIPGAVLLARMHRDGEVLEHEVVRGLACVRPERIPVTRETVFDLASLTKPVATTTALMLLVSEGAVQLDDPVAKVLPEFEECEKQEVTLRQLLTHSSGLRPWRGYHEPLLAKERKTGESWLATPQGREWILDRVIRSTLVHEPGEAAIYGDLDFIVLGAVVEALARQPLGDFCRERIFGPLGMADTRFLPVSSEGPVQEASGEKIDSSLRRRIAATEDCPWRRRVIWGEVHDPNAWAMGGVAGHAGLFSTAGDLMRFGQTLLDVWHGRSEALPRATLRIFAERQGLQSDSDWALGWDTPTQGASSSGQHFSAQSIGHLGFTGTSLWVDFEQEAIVVLLTNRIHLVAKRSRFELRPIVHDHVIDAFLAG